MVRRHYEEKAVKRVTPRTSAIIQDTLAVILAGGQGERLYPLTKHRAKPAVPFGGIYRIIDFSLSNCINSQLKRIAVLTQYKSDSLDRHIRLGWNIFSYDRGSLSSPFRRSSAHLKSGIRERPTRCTKTSTRLSARVPTMS